MVQCCTLRRIHMITVYALLNQLMTALLLTDVARRNLCVGSKRASQKGQGVTQVTESQTKSSNQTNQFLSELSSTQNILRGTTESVQCRLHNLTGFNLEQIATNSETAKNVFGVYLALCALPVPQHFIPAVPHVQKRSSYREMGCTSWHEKYAYACSVCAVLSFRVCTCVSKSTFHQFPLKTALLLNKGSFDDLFCNTHTHHIGPHVIMMSFLSHMKRDMCTCVCVCFCFPVPPLNLLQ